MHPELIAQEYNVNQNHKILEVYAFYHHSKQIKNGGLNHQRSPDKGTVLRFLELSGDENACSTASTLHDVLKLQKVDPLFVDATSQAAYCDHWVSNVFDRTEFLDTLHDTLGFSPKVDFNAGVVAAGEAQIESTVTGNTARPIDDPTRILMDQSQVYLPINNALSEVGHVHGFLQELGQGIQHIASRVSNLVDFVQRCNDYREITNEGTFYICDEYLHLFYCSITSSDVSCIFM
jgi:hypothetical protein